MFGKTSTTIAKYGSLSLISFVLVAGLSIPLSVSPQSWLEFPIIPGLEDKARNLFFHVPMSWTAVVAFITSAIYGIKYLRSKDIDFDVISVSAAGLGLLFSVLATVTGALWARFNWGAFWNWDPRQTSIFILLLIYGAYFALRSAIDSDEKRARLSAVYTILSGLTVPFLVFIMPRMMAGLHPGAMGDESGKGPLFETNMIAPNMRVLFYLSLLGFTMFFVWLLHLRVRVGRLELQLHQNGK
jgi:heme exporter protein C